MSRPEASRACPAGREGAMATLEKLMKAFESLKSFQQQQAPPPQPSQPSPQAPPPQAHPPPPPPPAGLSGPEEPLPRP